MMMNLITDPWIPSLLADGRRELFNLHDLFAQADTLRDLAVKPHERIALMRLLICITQAALDGPADEDEWADCGHRIQPAVRAYLERWKSSFELFGDGLRFLQVPELLSGKETDNGNPATKLDLALSTGNNSVLFDNDAGAVRVVDAARAALNLLTFQCFSPGGRIGIARWHDKDTPGNGSSNHAPCTPSSMLHTFILGDHLLATIARNLLTKELISDNASGWGKPIWELPVNRPDETRAIQNATTSYLGRLVPVARAIRLNETGETIVLANGLDYPIFPAFRETTATIVQRKDEMGVLSAAIGRSLWRQLYAITVKRRAATDQLAGPLALALNAITHDTTLWIGALVTDKAKIVDLIEAAYVVPSSLFDAPGRAAYEEAVEYAKTIETKLRNAVGTLKFQDSYCGVLKLDKSLKEIAQRHYWTRLEQNLADLFTVARELTPPDDLPASAWGVAVHKAAHDAYAQSCPRGTPRQLQAYALGLRHLHHTYTNSNPAKSKSTKAKAHA